MSKVIEFPNREKRIERLLREQLPLELSSDSLEELATELRKAAERIDDRPKSFNIFFPSTYSEKEMEFITRQVEDIIEGFVEVIKGEEGEIFNLIIRYHLLLHQTKQIIDSD